MSLIAYYYYYYYIITFYTKTSQIPFVFLSSQGLDWHHGALDWLYSDGAGKDKHIVTTGREILNIPLTRLPVLCISVVLRVE